MHKGVLGMALAEYKKGEILLVYVYCSGYHNTPSDGFPVRFIKSYEGTEDLSYHGSPWYETFIEAEDLESGEVKSYGDQNYRWISLNSYLKKVKEASDKSVDLLRFL